MTYKSQKSLEVYKKTAVFHERSPSPSGSYVIVQNILTNAVIDAQKDISVNGSQQISFICGYKIRKAER